jgi:hypothetical protein
VPLGFNPICLVGSVREVTVALPLFNSMRAKMSQLEEVLSGRLEAEGCVLVEVVAEHVLLCFHSQDPQMSLEPVVQGPDAETEEAVRASIQDTTKLVAAQFKHQAEDS